MARIERARESDKGTIFFSRLRHSANIKSINCPGCEIAVRHFSTLERKSKKRKISKHKKIFRLYCKCGAAQRTDKKDDFEYIYIKLH